MRLDYSTAELHKGNRSLCHKDYQYWLILGGEGTVEKERQESVRADAVHFTAGDMLEIPIDMPLVIHAETSISIGRITLSDFTITNTLLHHYPASPALSLVRRTFFYALDMLSEKLPDLAHFHAHIDQVMLDLIMMTSIDYTDQNRAAYALILDIRAHYLKPDYSLQEAIKATGFSESYVRKAFRETTGVTPVEFMNNLRLEHAKALMQNDPLTCTIRFAALESGFHDPYYFSRLFHTKLGQTPSEYLTACKQAAHVASAP